MLLIDGDIVLYQIGFKGDSEDSNLLEQRGAMFEFINDLMRDTETDEFRIFLSSDENFRTDIDPEYKKNREGHEKPKFYSQLKDDLISKYNAEIVLGLEADDMMGMNQTDETTICTIDKDLKMVPGWHYDWKHPEIGLEWISPEDAFRNFCLQCLTGDPTDNIPGMFKIIGKKAMPKIKERLYITNEPSDMWGVVNNIYKDHLGALDRISKLLWIKHIYKTADWMDDLFNTVT